MYFAFESESNYQTAFSSPHVQETRGFVKMVSVEDTLAKAKDTPLGQGRGLEDVPRQSSVRHRQTNGHRVT